MYFLTNMDHLTNMYIAMFRLTNMYLLTNISCQTFDKNSDGIVSETEMTTRAELAFKVPMHWNNEYYILFYHLHLVHVKIYYYFELITIANLYVTVILICFDLTNLMFCCQALDKDNSGYITEKEMRSIHCYHHLFVCFS